MVTIDYELFTFVVFSIKIMQSLLECMIRQSDKVERFKRHQRSNDGIHAKFSVHTKVEVVRKHLRLFVGTIKRFFIALKNLTLFQS